MREMSVAEQRYQAVLAVIAEGETIKSVADRWRVSPQTVHAWLARYVYGRLWPPVVKWATLCSADGAQVAQQSPNSNS
jgi:transposase